MTRRQRWLTYSATAMLVGSFLVFGWPTPYRRYGAGQEFQTHGVIAFRENRVTGRVDLLHIRRGWVRLNRTETLAARIQRLSRELP